MRSMRTLAGVPRKARLRAGGRSESHAATRLGRHHARTSAYVRSAINERSLAYCDLRP